MPNAIGSYAMCLPAIPALRAGNLDHEVEVLVDSCAVPAAYHARGLRLLDQCRTGNDGSGAKATAIVDRARDITVGVREVRVAMSAQRVAATRLRVETVG